MHPRRPDSAKTQLTKQTLDSEYSKRQLNSSKFSETFSSGVNSFHEKPDQFRQYVAEKDKDPKFKHLKSKLEVIQEKAGKQEEPKPSYKPFQRKKDKTVDRGSKKVEQKQQKPEEQLNLSRGFAEKNKQKMNSLKVSAQLKQQEEEKNNDKAKSKINFDSFKIHKPGEKKEPKKDIKIELKKEQKKAQQSKQTNTQNGTQKQKTIENNAKVRGKTREEIDRQNQIKNIERYVSQIQARNMQVFPRHYDRMVSASPANTEDLQKIDINNFLDEPTEEDYQLLKLKIQEFDKKLQSGVQQQSIDLQQIIKEGNASEADLQKQEQQLSQNESFLQSMSAAQLKKRNAFLTQVLAGKISKKQIDQLEEMNRSAMRMHKLDHQKEDENQIQLTEMNMMKRKSNRLMERNRLQAAGQLYRDCDYLSEDQKQRLEELINGDFGESPFQCDQLERIRRRNIDEGIRMYRDITESSDIQDILDEESLPKDPQLRREAEKKVLRQKIKSVNERLGDVDKMTVTKGKIQSLIKRFENTRRSSSFHELCSQTNKKFEENIKRLQQAQRLLNQLEEKQNINEILDDIQGQYLDLQLEIKRWSQIDEVTLKRLEKERLQRKLREVEEIEKQNLELQNQIRNIQNIKREIQQNLKLYDQIQIVEMPQLACQGYSFNESLQDIDAVVTRKWQKSLKDPSSADTDS